MKRELTLVRTSERMKFKRCRHAWQWAYNDRLVSRSTKPALRFGSLVHDALAHYYRPGVKRGPHPARTFLKLYRADAEALGNFRQRDLDEDWVDAEAMGVSMLERYIDHYGRDSAIEIIAPEYPFAYEMKDAGGVPFVYVGRFDALFRWLETGEFGLLEHKTATAIKDEHLQLDEQAGSYWAFAPMHLKQIGQMELLDDLDMILYNFLRKAKPDAREQDEAGHYLNKDGTISKQQPAPYFQRVPVYRDEVDRRRVLRRIRMEAFEMRLVREGKLPVYKNPMKDCSWDCQFYDACELHETGSDYRSFIKQSYDVGDPYAEYRADLGLE